MTRLLLRAAPVAGIVCATTILLALTGGPADAIVGGRYATPEDDPSMVALVTRGVAAEDGQFCGGAAIAPQVVVTAAHCIEETPASKIDVVVGVIDVGDPAGERIAVTEAIASPSYDKIRTIHDIAVLKLASPMSIPTMEVAGPGDEVLGAPGALLRLTGWGLQEYNNDDSWIPNLKFAEIPVAEPGTCEEIFDSYDDTIQLCGQSAGNDPDSCQGDSGGPMIGGSPAARLVGVVSYGSAGCGDPGQAGVYARVSSERDWILQTAGLPNVAPGATLPPPPAPTKAKGSVTLRYGQMSCGVTVCQVGVRVSGSARSQVKALSLSVRRPKQRGYDATRLSVKARKVGPGQYRARPELPYGKLILTAVAFNGNRQQLGKAVTERIEVVYG